MSQQSFSAGQAHGHNQQKKEEWVQSAQHTANAAKDKTSEATQSASDSLQLHGHSDAAGFLQQTGESVKNMAQGAVDTMKNTLGVGERKNN